MEAAPANSRGQDPLRWVDVSEDLFKLDLIRLTTVGLVVQEDRSRFSTIKANDMSMKGDLNRLKGADYEQYVEDKAVHRAYADLHFIQARPVRGPRSRFQPTLSSALARARKKAADQARPLPELTDCNNFVNSDIIIADMGNPDTRNRRTPPAAYALFEASFTADSDDVQRAKSGAHTLATIMQVPVTPAVITLNTPEQGLQQAADAGVKLFLVPDR